MNPSVPTAGTGTPEPVVLRFGSFDVDLRAGELRKGGVKIKLYGQPFNVLAILLERPGEVVTREQLQQTLWAGDTFVDFEHGLNKAINRVREALGDDADNPRFVETLPRRGYRFIAPVDNVSSRATRPLANEKLPPRASWRQVLLWSAVSVAVAALAGVAVWYLKPPSTVAKPVTRFTIALPPGQHLAGLDQPALALSPDGTKLAYVAAAQDSVQRIYVRAMDSTESVLVAGTGGAVNPFFSPDGQWLGFVSGSKLMKVPVKGGAAQTLAEAPTIVGASWGDHHAIVFSAQPSALRSVPEAGGTTELVSQFGEGETAQEWPEILPGSKAVVFMGLFPPRIAIQPLGGGGERRNLPQGYVGSRPHYTASGHLIYAYGANLMAVPFDLDRLQVRGAATPVVQGVLTSQIGGSQYSVSASGSLAYISGGLGGLHNRLAWVSRSGREQLLLAPANGYLQPRLSPDGRQIAVDIQDSRGRQVWLYDLARDTLSQFTFEGGTNEYGTWTPDGKRLAFTSNKEGPLRVFWQAADGSGRPERLAAADNRLYAPFSWSPDGQLLGLIEVVPPANPEIWVMRVTDRSAKPFLSSRTVEDAPQFSPDGRWLAYCSNESGRREIYVRPYPGPGGKWQISTGGGTEPVWNRNGRELFYRTGDKMMVVDIRTQPGFTAGKPRELFESHYLSTEAGFARPNYDVSPDGQRFLMLKPIVEEQEAPTQINVVLNWTEELKRLVPTGSK